MGQLSSRLCAGSPWGGMAGCQGGGAQGSGCWQRKRKSMGAEPERTASQSRRPYAAGSPHRSWQSTGKHTEVTVTNIRINKNQKGKSINKRSCFHVCDQYQFNLKHFKIHHLYVSAVRFFFILFEPSLFFTSFIPTCDHSPVIHM